MNSNKFLVFVVSVFILLLSLQSVLSNPAVAETPSDNSVIKPTDSIFINISSGVGLDHVNYSIYNSSLFEITNSSQNTTATLFNYTIDPSGWLENDLHTIAIFANDSNGVNYTNFTYKTDGTNPAVTSPSINDSDDIVRNSTAILINVTVSDLNFATGTVVVGNSVNVSLSNNTATNWNVTINTSTVGCTALDGACVLTFYATDDAGNINNSVTYSITVDETAPVINSVQLSDYYVQNDTNVTVTVNVTETNVQSVTAEGFSLVAQGGGIYSGSIALISGQSPMNIVATDLVGLADTDSTQGFTIDDILPAVTNTSINDSDLKVKSADMIEINVTVTDANISSVSVRNGTIIAMSNSTLTMWNVTTSASALGCSATDGACILRFNATDEAGNTNNTVTYTITIDDVKPAVYNVSFGDSDDIVRNSTTIQLNVSVNDTNIASGTVKVRNETEVGMSNIGGNLWSVNKSAQDLGCTVLDGLCLLTFSAIDEVGNQNNSVTYSITVDETAPVINSVQLSDYYVQNDTNVTVTVNVTETNVQSVTAEGFSLVAQGGGIYSGSIALISGQSPMNIVATDLVGLADTNDSQTFTIDDTNPSVILIPLEFPANNSNYSINDFLFNFTISDTQSSTFICGLIVDDSVSDSNTSVLNATNTTLAVSGLTDAVYNWSIGCNDSADNQDMTSIRYFTVDTGGNPSISLDTLSNGSVIQSSVLVNITITSSAGLDYVNYSIYNQSTDLITSDSNTSPSTPHYYSIDPSGWDEGVWHAIVLFANGTNSMTNQSTFDFITDDTNPVVSAISFGDPDNKTALLQNVQINVTVQDPSFNGGTVTVGNASTVAMSPVGGNIWSVTTNGSALGCTATDGPCKITFIATDDATNVNDSEYMTFTIDDVNPAVSSPWINDSDDLVRNITDIIINVTVVDTNIALGTVTVGNGVQVSMSNVGGNLWSVTTNGTAMGCTALDGSCLLTFIATDEIGNINNSVTYTITIDETAPVINSATLSDNTVNNNTNVTATVSITETNILSVTADGVSLSGQGGGIYSGTVTLTTGNSPVTIVATDLVGLSDTDNTLTYIIDDTAPYIDILTPLNGSSVKTTVINFTVNDTLSGINSSTISVSGVSGFDAANDCTGSGNYSCSFSALSLAQGTNTFTITAYDNAANPGTNSSTFTYDTAGPLLTIYAPVSGSNYVITTPFNWSVTDVSSSVSTVGYFLDGSTSLSVLEGAVNSTTFNFSAGYHTVIFSANDSMNNWRNSSVINFTVIAPINMSTVEAAIENIINGVFNVTYANGTQIADFENVSINNTFTVNLSLNDTGSPVQVLLGDVNGLRVTWNQTFNSSTNETTTSSTINDDFTTTVIDMVWFDDLDDFLPDNNGYYGTLILDRGASEYTHIIWFEDEDDLATGGKVIVKTPTAGTVCSGTYDSVSFSNSDTAPCYIGNGTNTKVFVPHFSVIVLTNDTGSPNITVVSPAQPNQSSSYFKPNITVSLDAAGCNYTYDGTENTMNIDTSGATGYCWGGYELIPNGLNYNITFEAWDDVPNNKTLLVYFNVSDYDAPEINVTSPANGSTVTSSSMTLSLDLDEPANVTYSLNGAANVSCYTISSEPDGDGSCTVTVSNGADQNITVYALDTNEYLNSTIVYFTVSISSPPTTPPSSPDSSTSSGLPTSISTNIDASTSHVWDIISAGVPVVMNSYVDSIPVSSITLTTKERVENVEIRLNSLKGHPSEVPAELAASVYKYIEIAADTDLSASLETAEIKFSVPLSWFAENNVVESDLVLYSYHNSQWMALSTTRTGSDSSSVNYISITSHFSYFAIGGLQEPEVLDDEQVVIDEPPADTVEPAVQGQDNVDDVKPSDSSGEADGQEKSGTGRLIGIFVSIVVLIGAIGLIIFRKMKNTPETASPGVDQTVRKPETLRPKQP